MACIFAHVISITLEMTLQRFYCRKKIAQPNTREQNDVKHERTKIDNSIPVLGRYSLAPKQLGSAGSNIAMVCGWEEMNHQN